jgi:hypothetical protein
VIVRSVTTPYRTITSVGGGSPAFKRAEDVRPGME